MKAKTFKRLVGAAAAAVVVGMGSVGAAPPDERSWESGTTTVTYDGYSTLTVSSRVIGPGMMEDYEHSMLNGESNAPWGDLLRYGYVKEVVISASVTRIGAFAFFASSSDLNSVTCGGSPPTVGTGAFANPQNLSLFVEVSAIDAYLNAEMWQYFGYINPSTVTFDLSAGVGDIPPQKISYGGKVIRPPDDPTREGYKFNVWFADRGGTNPTWDFDNEVVTRDITLRASWVSDDTPLFTVTFDLNDGDGVPPLPQKVFSGNYVTKPADPKREGYEFIGWYVESDVPEPVKWDFDYPNQKAVYGDMTLKAEWTLKTSVSSPARSAAPSVSPRITLRGHTLTIHSSPAAVSQVRLLDVRGRTVRSFTSTATSNGNMNFSLTGVSAGRYFVEVREGGRRFRSGVVVR